MEARLVRLALVGLALSSVAATYRTPNFVVQAPSQEVARKVGTVAEQSRQRLARQWLGHEMPRWNKPCRVRVKVGSYGAGGATSFAFDNGHVFGWDMRVQGSLERVLDSVVPHEVSHTVFATYFRRPLPRWADEGAATLAEHESEKQKQRNRLVRVLDRGRSIPLRKLFGMNEYPRGMDRVLTLYAQGYSLAEFLVQQGGRRRYLHFLEEALRDGWDRALQHYYDFSSVQALERRWNRWVMAGSPRLDAGEDTQLADSGGDTDGPPSEDVVIRSQSPDEEDGTGAAAERSGLAGRGQTDPTAAGASRGASPSRSSDSRELKPLPPPNRRKRRPYAVPNRAGSRSAAKGPPNPRSVGPRERTEATQVRRRGGMRQLGGTSTVNPSP